MLYEPFHHSTTPSTDASPPITNNVGAAAAAAAAVVPQKLDAALDQHQADFQVQVPPIPLQQTSSSSSALGQSDVDSIDFATLGSNINGGLASAADQASAAAAAGVGVGLVVGGGGTFAPHPSPAPPKGVSDAAIVSEEARHHQESLEAWQRAFAFALRTDPGQLSPPSPSTVETGTDSVSGGDWMTGATSSVGGPVDDAAIHQQQHHQQQQHVAAAAAAAQHANRARSVSQPSSFAQRRANLSLSIPPDLGSTTAATNPQNVFPTTSHHHPFYPSHHHQTPAIYDVSPANPPYPSQEYFLNDPNPNAATGAYQGDFQKLANDMQAMADSNAAMDQQQQQQQQHMHQGQARYGYRLPASQPSSPVRSGYPPGMAPYSAAPQPNGGRPRGVTVSGMTAFPTYAAPPPPPPPPPPPIPTTVVAENQPTPAPHTPSQQQVNHAILNTPHSQQSSHHPFSPIDSPASHIGLVSTPMPMHPNSSPFASTNANNSPIVHLSQTPSNAVPHLETQASFNGLGMIEMPQMDYRQRPSNAGSHEDTTESMSQSVVLDDSRRSSAQFPPPPPSMAFNQHLSIERRTASSTPDLSEQVQEKLTFLENLAKSVDAAKAAVLHGDGNRADNLLSDVGHAIFQKNMQSSQHIEAAPAISLSVPTMEQVISQPTSAVDSGASSCAAPNSAEMLQAPFELSRPNSTKRSAPESPAIAQFPDAHKHMRMDEEMERPPVVHAAHSYPNGHQLPSQTAHPPPTLTMPPTPTQGLGGVAHMPHIPSPLSAVPMQPGFSFEANAPQWPAQMPDMAAFQPPPPPIFAPDAAMVPVQQPVEISRRGSIVDGRLIAGRPGPLTHTASPSKAASTSAIPTMSTIDFDDDDNDDSDDDGPDRPRSRRPSENAPPGSLVLPPDLISEHVRRSLDGILHEFLNKVCSDLEYHDAKGELLHQALMPKKMAKLDESTDFRPFKFRIQAFTNAFQEELQRMGVLDETLSSKKIKSYLWTQPLISRYNEDGKKSKSKGNHIWNVDARKLQDGRWIFREFQRKIAPSPPTQAYYGSMYSWSARVWDPQASTTDLDVTFSSPEGSLPSWLSWNENVLSGLPREGDQGGQVVALARFMDSSGVELELSQTFTLHVSHLDELARPEPNVEMFNGGFGNGAFPMQLDMIPPPGHAMTFHPGPPTAPTGAGPM